MGHTQRTTIPGSQVTNIVKYTNFGISPQPNGEESLTSISIPIPGYATVKNGIFSEHSNALSLTTGRDTWYARKASLPCAPVYVWKG